MVLAHFLHRYLIWLVLTLYVTAAIAPQFGLWIRDTVILNVRVVQGTTHISLPMLLLALLLLNAGMGIHIGASGEWLRSTSAIIFGVFGNLLIPLFYILAVAQVMHLWHNSDEVQNILVGLALVGSMPIAGSSTAWAQNANGDMSVSLGLVLLSTFVSPITTPIMLRSVALMTSGDYSEDLHELAGYGTGAFLLIFILLPSLLGIGIHAFVSTAAMNRIRPALKVFNAIVLLLLSYSNAAVSLPDALRQHDLDFLAVTLAITSILCVIAFLAGWAIARANSATREQEAALMFGLGMNNNGTGLVLASAALADHPFVMLPIIFYNLVQHLIAATVDHLRYRSID